MGEPTPEELLQIANGFILASPPGEFNEVLTDVRTLLQDDALLNRTAVSTFKEYNTDQMLQVMNGDKETMVTKCGELSPTEYLDPSNGFVFTFDHVKQKVTGSRPISGELDSSAEPFRRTIDDALQNYVSQHYPNGTGITFGSSSGGEQKITLCVASSRYNSNNFWNGRWRSEWVAQFKPGGSCKFTGKIRVHVHYYEDGNVQLLAKYEKVATFNLPSDAKSVGEALIKQMMKIEQDYQTALEHSYNTMGETTFKALRRVLPITRTKIDWQKIQFYKVGAEGATK